jgi:hypothetical protein
MPAFTQLDDGMRSASMLSVATLALEPEDLAATHCREP